MRRVAAMAFVLAVSLAGCSSRKAAVSATPTPTARPSSSAVVKIDSPANGSTVKGPTIRLVVTLSNAKIVPFTTKAIRPDEGHIHVRLDGTLVTMTAGLTTTISGVKPGTHLIEVEFVAADHAPFSPRVYTGNTFRVS